MKLCGILAAGAAILGCTFLMCTPAEMTTLSNDVNSAESLAQKVEPILGGACAVVDEIPALAAIDIVCAGVEAADAFVANLPPMSVMSRVNMVDAGIVSATDGGVKPVLVFVRVSLHPVDGGPG